MPVIGRTSQMTRDAGLEVDPALSPNGETVAYAAGPPTGMQIYVRQVSGGRSVALTSDTTGNFRWPRWSPDGSQLAYQGNDGIYVVPALGGAPRRLTHIDLGTPSFGIESGTPLTGFDWSPDGSRIVSSRGFGGKGITVTTIATGDTVNLPAPFAASSPVWSPDGRSIAVVAGNPLFTFGTGYFGNAGTSGIWIVHLDGTSPTRIAPDSALNISPQWAPDGRAIFWVSDRDGSRDIYRQRISRSGAVEGAPRRLTTGTDAQGLSLTRKGDRMAYARLHTYSSIWSIPVPLRGTGIHPRRDPNHDRQRDHRGGRRVARWPLAGVRLRPERERRSVCHAGHRRRSPAGHHRLRQRLQPPLVTRWPADRLSLAAERQPRHLYGGVRWHRADTGGPRPRTRSSIPTGRPMASRSSTR